MPGVLGVAASVTMGSGGLECELGFKVDSRFGQRLALYAVVMTCSP